MDTFLIGLFSFFPSKYFFESLRVPKYMQRQQWIQDQDVIFAAAHRGYDSCLLNHIDDVIYDVIDDLICDDITVSNIIISRMLLWRIRNQYSDKEWKASRQNSGNSNNLFMAPMKMMNHLLTHCIPEMIFETETIYII